MLPSTRHGAGGRKTDQQAAGLHSFSEMKGNKGREIRSGGTGELVIGHFPFIHLVFMASKWTSKTSKTSKNGK